MYPAVGICDQAERQPVFFDEFFMRAFMIGADSQNFGILGLELLVIVRTGRLQVLDSCGSKVQDIEIDQNILSPQAAELEFSALGAV